MIKITHLLESPVVIYFQLMRLVGYVIGYVFKKIFNLQKPKGLHIEAFPGSEIYLREVPVATSLRIFLRVKLCFYVTSFEYLAEFLILRSLYLLLKWVFAVNHINQRIFGNLSAVLARCPLLMF